MKLLRLPAFLLIAFGILWSATIAYVYNCSLGAAVLTDPNQPSRVGYLTSFNGLGLALPADIQVHPPFEPKDPQFGAVQGAAGGVVTANVVGIIEQFKWSGGLSDPVTIQFYVSQANATRLKALGPTNLMNTSFSSIGWWIGDYDQQAKIWFEEAKPVSSPTVKALIQGSSAQPMLSVDMTPVPIKSGIVVYVYKVSLTVIPQAHQVSGLLFANSSSTPSTITWGVQ